MESVYCAVSTEFLYITRIRFVFKGLIYVLQIGHIKTRYCPLSNFLTNTFKFQCLW